MQELAVERRVPYTDSAAVQLSLDIYRPLTIWPHFSEADTLARVRRFFDGKLAVDTTR